MNLFLIATDGYFSSLIARRLIQDKNNIVTGIMFLPQKKGHSTYLSTIVNVLRTSGFRFLCFKVLVQFIFICARYLRKMKFISHPVSLRDSARLNGISCFDVNDCNSNKSLNIIRDNDVDVIVSINVYQKIKNQTIQIAKKASLNVHFGLLPKYRGMSPYIWALARNEKKVGITVHHLVEGFDCGDIVQQDELLLYPKETVFSLYVRCCEASWNTLSTALKLIKENNNFGIKQVGEPSYFSLPTKTCIKELRKNGYNLVNLTDLFTFFSSWKSN
jgi:folate-dependent phosphoribosylglycinamide formyltransferase PurN